MSSDHEYKNNETKEDYKIEKKIIVKTKEKKRPGRPRKNPRKIPIGIEGIVKQPKNKTNIVELFYHNPNNFKKIIQFLHQESVTDVELLFTSNEMIWIAEDAVGQSIIKLIVNGSKVNRYYCNSIYTLTINFDDLKVVGDKLDSSSYDSITFILNDKCIRQSLDFLLETSIKISELTDVKVEKFRTRTSLPVQDNKEKPFTKYLDTEIYPLSFEIPGKYLKKMILDIKIDSAWAVAWRGDKKGTIFKRKVFFTHHY